MKEQLEIKPEGWTEKLIIREGNWQCGKAKDGISIAVSKQYKDAPGGVLTNEDAKILADAIYEHLDALNNHK